MISVAEERDIQEQQNRLLSFVQSGFPLAADPYQELGDTLSIDAEKAYALMQDSRAAGLVRRVGPVFDSYRLGYVSTLCATSVSEERIEEASAAINRFVNVTHNYLRENKYNIWFTVIACGDGELRRIVGDIEAHIGSRVLLLPATRLFKIKVDFNLAGAARSEEVKKAVVPKQVQACDLDERARCLVRASQDFAFDGRYPYADLAQELSDRCEEAWDSAEVLRLLAAWKDAGVIRRFGVTLRHHKAGFSANVMGAWDIPDDQVEQAGELMATFGAVSHCYERPRIDDWPNNLYTMIHGRTREECEAAIAEILEALQHAGVDASAPSMLFTKRELKKTSMRYFCEENL